MASPEDQPPDAAPRSHAGAAPVPSRKPWALRRVLRLRWFLYGALIVYFGVQAARKYFASQTPPSAIPADATGPGGLKPTRYYTMPDGQLAPVYEVTPEEAKRHFGVTPKAGEPTAQPLQQPAEPSVPDTLPAGSTAGTKVPH